MTATVRAASVLAAAAAAATTGAGGAPVRHEVLRLVDRSRVAHLGTGATVPRLLVTDVRIPRAGRPPYPLVVFAHGFDLRPSDYDRLLDAWARAGFVVAAPLFPVEGAGAPGGPSRADLPNEPGDLRFVIGRLTAPHGPLAGLVAANRVAVAGQSDGGVAALSVADDARLADRRVSAAIVLSGAELGGFVPARRRLPLLAVQGTQDPFNAPATTAAYFHVVPRPKFLLWLDGAGHKEPYTTGDRWTPVVLKTTVAFLDRYLRGGPLRRLETAGNARGVATLVAEP